MYTFRIPVDYLKEGNTIVAICPVLDVSAYGKTLAEATKNFKSALRAFVKHTTENNTIDEVLSEKGWTKIETDHEPRLSPPALIKSDTEEVALH